MPGMTWRFDNTYARLPAVFFSRTAPVPVKAPACVVFNRALAQELGLHPEAATDEDLADIFSGNVLPLGAEPLAQAYAGHQFGGFAMLGDGRAHLLGEHVTPDERRVDIQLKGSGPTAFSRNGDGRAALGPMLREYIISEAMHGLGIPTTRSLAVVTTGETVRRDRPLTGAGLTRIAASHLRVGTFEYARALGDIDSLRALVDYAVARHDPSLMAAENRALAFLGAVMERQADLIAHWMRVGFIHGVMNTDNMAISGETIDYGPCAFMDSYHPETVFSSIDTHGRYAFGNQPAIAQWNLARLAEALLPLIDDSPQRALDLASEKIIGFKALFHSRWLTMMGTKIGLQDTSGVEDEKLVNDLLTWLEQEGADYTHTFRALTRSLAGQDMPFSDQGYRAWHPRWRERLARQGRPEGEVQAAMQRVNPAVIARNHRVEATLIAANEGDLTPMHLLLEALSNPYEEDARLAPFQTPPPADAPPYRTFCGT